MRDCRAGRSFRLLVAVLILWSAAAPALAQIIENPKTPPAPNAGRVLNLREVSRITDEKGKFFFVQPFEVFTGRDGSVYVQEYNQLLQFDPQGRFVRNLVRKGEGPGEINDNLTGVQIRDRDILLWSSNSLKMVRLGLDGKMIEDRRFGTERLGSLIGASGGKLLFLRSEIGERPVVSGIYTRRNRLVVASESGTVAPTEEVLLTTEAFHLGARSASVSTISRPMPAPVGDGSAFIFHSPEYLIRLLDIGTGRIVRSFRREYDRAMYAFKPRAGYPAELVPKYHNDLCRLLWRNDRLWAVTSTIDPKKGILVDVFDRQGKYLDNFYLPLFKIRHNNPQLYAPMALFGNFLYLLEADEDDLISLIKYEIIGE